MKVPDLSVGKQLFCGVGNPVALGGGVVPVIRGSGYIEGPLMIGAEAKFAGSVDNATLMLSNTINADCPLAGGIPASILKIRSTIVPTPIDVVMGDPAGPVGVSIYGGTQAPFTVVANAISLTTVKLLETSKAKTETAAAKTDVGNKAETGTKSQTGLKHNLSAVFGSAIQKITAPVACADVKTSATTLNSTHAIAVSKKSFDIPHPSKEGHRLRYICLEGPDAEVYMRGKLVNSNTIELPDYWRNLVEAESIGVTLTPIGHYQELFLEKIEWGTKLKIKNNSATQINCSYVVYGIRKDVEKNIAEYKGLTEMDYPGDNNQYKINDQ